MIHAVVQSTGGESLKGEWTTLATGFPRETTLGNLHMSSADIPADHKAGYGKFKEIMWEALNGLPPRVADPLTANGDATAARESFELWSLVNTARLRAAGPFDAYYVNDWQHLPQGRLLRGRKPVVMHFHAPLADWTPPGWREYVLHHAGDFDAFVVSTAAYARALKGWGYEGPVYHVYPWVHADEYPEPSTSAVHAFEDRHGIRPDDEVVLNVGRMDPVKGQDRLIRALPALLRTNPRAKLVLVGNGSFSSSKRAGIGLSKGARWRASLESLARELGVEDRVVFTGHVPHKEVLPAFHRADAFAFPSVKEGFGLAVVEAWLAGVPPVVSDGAGISEIIRSGQNGVVVRRDEPEAYARALAEALGPDGDAMGAAGRQTAFDVCEVRVSAPRVLEILDAHAGGRRADLPELVA